MRDADSDKRRLILEAGSLVILHPDGPAGGFPMVVNVDRVADGQHWFLGSCDPLGKGDRLMVEYPVPHDARYVTQARVTASSAATFALEIGDLWERVQQRAFVRISAHGLEVRVLRKNQPLHDTSCTDASSQEAVHPLLDVSAGGIRFQSSAEFEPLEEVVCHFELPGSLCFVLPARIVRAGEDDAEGTPGKPEVAVEFIDLAESHRSQLLRWVYREQVSRHRQAMRKSGAPET